MILGDSNTFIEKIIIDSRLSRSNTLFIPIIGEKYDGHIFMEEAYAKGCRNFLCDKNHSFLKKDINLIVVDDTTEALCNIAKGYKNRFNIPFIAVTGSVGKTSTKDIISSVLSTEYDVLKTQGNLNNNIGLSKTLLNLDNLNDIAVLELGMDKSLEIAYLSNMINPNIAVITNIGMSHIMNFKDGQEGIYKAKMEIVDGLKDNGLLIVNGDDKFLGKLESNNSYKVIKCGFSSSNDIYCKSYNIDKYGTSFICVYKNKEYEFSLNTIAKHNILNAMFGVVIGLEYDIDYEQIKKGLLNCKFSSNRLDISITDKYIIINDTYNACYESVISAFDVLNNFEGRKVAILGDILELGDYSKEIHQKIGKNIDCDLLITIGNYSKYIGEGAVSNSFDLSKWYHFLRKEDFYNKVNELLFKGDIVLAKASRAMKFDEIVEFLKN